MNAIVSALVSAVRKEGKPVVRLSCADYGHEWIVACDVYPVDELSVKPRSAGAYVFGHRPGSESLRSELAAGSAGSRLRRHRLIQGLDF